MNDTITTPRQSEIVNLVAQNAGLSRSQIANFLASEYAISIPTLSRDLKVLVDIGAIIAQGKGRSIKYFPSSDSLIMRSFDTESYFSKDPDQRKLLNPNFDFKIFEKLTANNLFSNEELKKISAKQRNFLDLPQILDPNIYKKELERFVIELSWKSSKIEGNTYSLLQTETLIKQKEEAAGHEREEAVMILNHKAAFEHIMSNSRYYKQIDLLKIYELHDLISKDLGITRGIRQQGVGITGTAYKPLDNKFQIEEAMEKLVKAVNNSVHPLQKALMALGLISYIQPFTDGNKRTARMLSNALLMANDYFPLSYRSVNEEEYRKAVIILYEQGSFYHLKKIFIEQLMFSFDNYFA